MDAIRCCPWVVCATLAWAAGCAGNESVDSDSVDDTGETGPWTCGSDVSDTRDGEVYRSVVIGDQCWLKDNVNLGTMIESTAAGSQAHDDGAVEKYCWDNDVGGCDGSTGLKRGGFYEWPEAQQDYSGQLLLPVQGSCPDGFHIPSRDEWQTLVDLLGGLDAAPAKLAVGGESGFEALMTGYRCTLSGGFRSSAKSAETMTYFWTSEDAGSTNAWLWELGGSSMQTFAFRQSLGLSLRCIGDAAP
jgi:uncharacterized protein (TIGR02145 family)